MTRSDISKIGTGIEYFFVLFLRLYRNGRRKEREKRATLHIRDRFLASFRSAQERIWNVAPAGLSSRCWIPRYLASTMDGLSIVFRYYTAKHATECTNVRPQGAKEYKNSGTSILIFYCYIAGFSYSMTLYLETSIFIFIYP